MFKRNRGLQQAGSVSVLSFVEPGCVEIGWPLALNLCDEMVVIFVKGWCFETDMLGAAGP